MLNPSTPVRTSSNPSPKVIWQKLPLKYVDTVTKQPDRMLRLILELISSITTDRMAHSRRFVQLEKTASIITIQKRGKKGQWAK